MEKARFGNGKVENSRSDPWLKTADYGCETHTTPSLNYLLALMLLRAATPPSLPLRSDRLSHWDLPQSRLPRPTLINWPGGAACMLPT
jgi:hypothetical protein